MVMLTRMDIVWLSPINLTIYNNKFLYSAIWGRNNSHSIRTNGILGYWIFSNSDFIKKFGTLFENLSKYLNNTEYSYHIIAKKHINSFTNSIKYIFNDIEGIPIHQELQRVLYTLPQFQNYAKEFLKNIS